MYDAYFFVHSIHSLISISIIRVTVVGHWINTTWITISGYYQDGFLSLLDMPNNSIGESKGVYAICFSPGNFSG